MKSLTLKPEYKYLYCKPTPVRGKSAGYVEGMVPRLGSKDVKDSVLGKRGVFHSGYQVSTVNRKHIIYRQNPLIA